MSRIVAPGWIVLLAFVIFSAASRSQDIDQNGIGFVLVHPPFSETYRCSEHWDGQLRHLGDALGTDCTIWRTVKEKGRLWVREYSNSGLENQDWFGYGADVLAPCSCTVSDVHINPVENVPGNPGEPPASWVTFERPDGARIWLAHVKDILVSKGDTVIAGDVVASVGNNGFSMQPHVHIGAWRNETPLQIRFDQKLMRGKANAAAKE